MNATADYYADGSLSTLTYDFLENSIQMTRGDVALYKELAAGAQGRILDVGTGTGRIAWALAEEGHEVLGVDFSEGMLAQARAKAPRYPEEVRGRVRFERQNMAELALEERFDLILVPYRTLNHLLTPELQRAGVAALRRHLTPGGLAVVHTFDPPPELFANPERRGAASGRIEVTHPKTGQRLLWEIVERQVDILAQVMRQTVGFRVERSDGAVIAQSQETITLRWLTQQEMRYLCELEGLAVEAVYGDFEKGPPVSGKEQVWLLRPAP